MATTTITFDYNSGANIYIRIFGRTGSQLGLVFDAADNTFKDPAGTTTTPYIQCTERAYEDGTGKSSYTATVDLSNINSTFVLKDYVVRAFDNATPSFNDQAIGEPVPFSVQVSDLGRRQIEPELGAAFTTTSGVEVRLSVFLNVDGERYVLPGTAIGTIVVREHGEGTNLYTVAGTANAQGRFELSQELPNYTGDRLYNHSVTITVDGVAFTKDFDVPNYA
ncbi:MAG: hypothetical protein KDA77_00045 [Planctomycetaceae bacterium]|nr:hypothetical protein [Planctomycetaceae bacterium]